MRHMMWATEQSCIRPGAKLLALYLANYAGMADDATFMLQDAAAWCCCEIEEVDDFLGDLERESELRVRRDYPQPDKYLCSATVFFPEARNGGKLL